VVVADAKDSRVVLSLHRYAQVGKGDVVFIDPEHPRRLSVVSSEDPNDLIRISPHFEQSFAIKAGALEFVARITELTSKEDIDSYAFLESFHYRTSTVPHEEEEGTDTATTPSSGGRRAVLLLYIKLGLRWQPIGYIELQMPLLMVKPRHELFAMPFRHPTRPVGWQQWDQHAIRENVNRIVRIARVVTSPEYRGLGISKVLIKAAKEFASERWHIGGSRPLFIEISAEMLKYLDFVSPCGLSFAGNTEGNLQRVYKDMTYMQRNYEISSGIMSLQKRYLVSLQKGADALGKTPDEMLQLVSDVAANPERAASLEPAEYYYLKSVLRFPIPYFIGGLDASAAEYVEAAIRVLQEKSPEKLRRKAPDRGLRIKPGHINYTSLTISTSYKLPKNKHVQAILDCFGLSGDSIQSRVISDLAIEATGGNIIFITGPSGCGKSLLLTALDQSIALPYVTTSRESARNSSYSVGWIRDLPQDVPLIEFFASRWGMEKALAALNQAGLSEAYVYLKPFSLLSRGQRYRARLADLALREDQVWLIDEFCADLDPMTARIVASNLRKHVVKYQRIAIVAAANHDHYLDCLRPTRVISLRHGFRPEIFTYKDYVDEFQHKVG
jgi:ABC-type transport system involved in cytochrome c biogenesis ATPase subunit/GNAT superfamily N-acetyltransferase